MKRNTTLLKTLQRAFLRYTEASRIRQCNIDGIEINLLFLKDPSTLEMCLLLNDAHVCKNFKFYKDWQLSYLAH